MARVTTHKIELMRALIDIIFQNILQHFQNVLWIYNFVIKHLKNFRGKMRFEICVGKEIILYFFGLLCVFMEKLFGMKFGCLYRDFYGFYLIFAIQRD